MKWYIGCSGFSYYDWKKTFYPPELASRDWLTYYATQFNTVELNVTFYKFPTTRTFQNFYNKTPADFTFTAKVPKIITHINVLNNCSEHLSNFYEAFENGLREKAGPVLFQFPPRLHYSPEFLELLIHSVSSNFMNVIEFRHSSWWRNDVAALLNKHNLTMAGADFPGLPNSIPPNDRLMYYRFHGVPHLYRSENGLNKLLNFMQAVSMQETQNIFVSFNNTINEAAIRDALHLRDLTCTS